MLGDTTVFVEKLCNVTYHNSMEVKKNGTL
jgi:hypothetical protein